MHFLTRNLRVIEELESYRKEFRPQPGSCGEFLLVMTSKGDLFSRSREIAREYLVTLPMENCSSVYQSTGHISPS